MGTSDIRRAYIDLLSNLLQIPGFDTLVPIDKDPRTFFIISNVDQMETLPAKGLKSDNTAYRETERSVLLNLDITVETDFGVHSSVEAEQLMSTALYSIKRGLRPEGFYVKQTRVLNIAPLHLTTKTRQIQRFVATIEHWVSEKNTWPGKIINNNPSGADWPTIYAPENLNRDWDVLINCNPAEEAWGCIYSPYDRCSMFGFTLDGNPAESEQQIAYGQW